MLISPRTGDTNVIIHRSEITSKVQEHLKSACTAITKYHNDQFYAMRRLLSLRCTLWQDAILPCTRVMTRIWYEPFQRSRIWQLECSFDRYGLRQTVCPEIYNGFFREKEVGLLSVIDPLLLSPWRCMRSNVCRARILKEGHATSHLRPD